MKNRTGLFLIAAACLACSPAIAGDRNSMEDQIACTPDVYRLCSQYIPNEDTIVRCLQQNGRSLSAACHKVIFPPAGQAQGNDDQD